jgi:DNA processing protein
MEKIKSWIQLLSAPDVGNAKAKRLVELLGSPLSFMHENAERLIDLDFIKEETKSYLANPKEPANWQTIANKIKKFDIKFVSILDTVYPPLLKNIYDPPLYFYYRGEWDKQKLKRCLAVVGTRKASNYGKMMTKQICSKLVEAGFTIVSGLAFGIDSIAHQSALEAGGTTVAVMGTGCDQVYPPQNRQLARNILGNGLLISEYNPGQPVEKWNFPTRNRIISGLSLGTLAIEGSKKSGALLTTKFALDQNRDIFALPGDVNRLQAEGPNYLIKLGAKIVTSVNDILEEYDLQLNNETRKFPELTKDEEKLYNLIVQHKPEIQFDQLIMKSGFSVSQLSTLLLNLELKSVIKKGAGNKVIPLY